MCAWLALLQVCTYLLQSRTALSRVSQAALVHAGIPIEKVSSDESEKLIKMEETLHTRVIGQEEAVVAISRAIRRARVGQCFAAFLSCMSRMYNIIQLMQDYCWHALLQPASKFFTSTCYQTLVSQCLHEYTCAMQCFTCHTTKPATGLPQMHTGII